MQTLTYAGWRWNQLQTECRARWILVRTSEEYMSHFLSQSADSDEYESDESDDSDESDESDESEDSDSSASMSLLPPCVRMITSISNMSDVVASASTAGVGECECV